MSQSFWENTATSSWSK